MTAFIDPIPVKEERERLAVTSDMITRALQGADALVWFAQYGAQDDSLEVSARLVASSTPNANSAQHYVARASFAFRKQIMEAAVAMARHDFTAGEDFRKRKGPKAP